LIFITHTLAKLDLKTMECEDIVRASTLLAEALWSNIEEMRKGQIAVVDYSGYNISVMTRYSLGDKITFMNVFWVRQCDSNNPALDSQMQHYTFNFYYF